MTHVHSDDCCINMRYREADDTPLPPLSMWKYYKDQMVEALNESYFTGEAIFYYDEEGTLPMIYVAVTGDDQEDMERRLTRFLKPRMEAAEEEEE